MTSELHLGKPNVECASCRLAFDSSNPSVASLRIADSCVPMLFFEYRICGKCADLLKKEGAYRDGALAGVFAYHAGHEADQ